MQMRAHQNSPYNVLNPNEREHMNIITRLKDLRHREHECTVEIIESLVQCNREKAYLEHGCSTLWDFLVREMNYSNAAASRRYKAMKCAEQFPQVVGMLRAGAGSPRGVVGVLRRLASDESVAAVVIRVDSPGGDPLAADLIWRAIRKLAERKPVVASLGDTAASGGYYVAMGATEIVAEPTTLTGSIGVVWLMLEVGGLLDEIGIRVEAVEKF